MRNRVQHPRVTNQATRERALLLSIMRSIWKSDTQEADAICRVLHLWRDVPQAKERDCKERGRQTLLLPGVLVLVQSAGQSLSLARRSGWAHESRRAGVAQGGRAARSWSLPHLLHGRSNRGASHPLIHDTPRNPMGRVKRHHPLPFLSRSDTPSARAASRRCVSAQVHGYGSAGGVA